MAQFSIILEDVDPSLHGSRTYTRRTEIIEADDLQSAWHQARDKYYLRQHYTPTQIVDIVPGEPAPGG